MRASNEKARRANAGPNFQTFNEVNDSTIPGEIELVRLRTHELFHRPAARLIS